MQNLIVHKSWTQTSLRFPLSSTTSGHAMNSHDYHSNWQVSFLARISFPTTSLYCSLYRRRRLYNTVHSFDVFQKGTEDIARKFISNPIGEVDFLKLTFTYSIVKVTSLPLRHFLWSNTVCFTIFGVSGLLPSLFGRSMPSVVCSSNSTIASLTAKLTFRPVC